MLSIEEFRLLIEERIANKKFCHWHRRYFAYDYNDIELERKIIFLYILDCGPITIKYNNYEIIHYDYSIFDNKINNNTIYRLRESYNHNGKKTSKVFSFEYNKRFKNYYRYD